MCLFKRLLQSIPLEQNGEKIIFYKISFAPPGYLQTQYQHKNVVYCCHCLYISRSSNGRSSIHIFATSKNIEIEVVSVGFSNMRIGRSTF